MKKKKESHRLFDSSFPFIPYLRHSHRARPDKLQNMKPILISHKAKLPATYPFSGIHVGTAGALRYFAGLCLFSF